MISTLLNRKEVEFRVSKNIWASQVVCFFKYTGGLQNRKQMVKKSVAKSHPKIFSNCRYQASSARDEAKADADADTAESMSVEDLNNLMSESA